jgi:hypothetical protein
MDTEMVNVYRSPIEGGPRTKDGAHQNCIFSYVRPKSDLLGQYAACRSASPFEVEDPKKLGPATALPLNVLYDWDTHIFFKEIFINLPANQFSNFLTRTLVKLMVTKGRDFGDLQL